MNINLKHYLESAPSSVQLDETNNYSEDMNKHNNKTIIDKALQNFNSMTEDNDGAEIAHESSPERKNAGIDLRKDGFHVQTGHKYIQVNIDLIPVKGDDNFIEKLKLNLVNSINSVINGTKINNETSSSYATSVVKINTEITCK
jgi:hypothetical protein